MIRHTKEHPTRNEEEYFAKENLDLVRRMRADLDAERARQERRVHLMKCPECGADLQQRDVNHAKVDLCPECHGIWLPKGEIALIGQLHRSGPGFVSHIMDDILDMFHHGRPSDTTAAPG
jgi:Zn-finger nucleic acid-binding protein